MTRDKKVLSLAKKMVEMSRDNGVVTEAKVGEVLAAVKQLKPRHELSLLKAYLYYIRKAVAEQTAVVASAGALSKDALASIETSFSKVYGRQITAVTKTDASLIAGLRIRVGDDVYDASVAGRLKRLAENVH